MTRKFLTKEEFKNLKNLYVCSVIESSTNIQSFKDFKRNFGISGNSSSRILDEKKWFLEKIKNGL